VHPTGGSLRVFKQFSWLEIGSCKVAFSRPAHQRVTHTVGTPLAKVCFVYLSIKEFPMESSVSVVIGRYVHKLNNLVGYIRVEIKLLQMRKSSLLLQDDSIATALDKIEKTAEEIFTLTDEFKLSFTTPQAGEFVSPKSVISQALQDSAVPVSIETVFESDDEIPDVHADKNLAEVFRNLFVNAVESMPDGGRLQISLRNNQTKNNVEVTVTDSGRGIPPYVANSLLFQPYYSTKEQKGHGLGLWWSRVYLESIGGTIALHLSEIGKGSSFLISIPTPELNK
jgi:signal transduction histidine kinase